MQLHELLTEQLQGQLLQQQQLTQNLQDDLTAAQEAAERLHGQLQCSHDEAEELRSQLDLSQKRLGEADERDELQHVLAEQLQSQLQQVTKQRDDYAQLHEKSEASMKGTGTKVNYAVPVSSQFACWRCCRNARQQYCRFCAVTHCL